MKAANIEKGLAIYQRLKDLRKIAGAKVPFVTVQNETYGGGIGLELKHEIVFKPTKELWCELIDKEIKACIAELEKLGITDFF